MRLKTPLVPIIGYAEMLKRSKGLSKEQKREIDAIYRNSLRTVDLTKKMEMLSKVEGGAIRQSLEKEDAAGIIEKTCKELGLYASHKKDRHQDTGAEKTCEDKHGPAGIHHCA